MRAPRRDGGDRFGEALEGSRAVLEGGCDAHDHKRDEGDEVAVEVGVYLACVRVRVWIRVCAR